MRNAGLEETQAGIKIAGRNINHLRYADDTTLVAESEEELTPPPRQKGTQHSSLGPFHPASVHMPLLFANSSFCSLKLVRIHVADTLRLQERGRQMLAPSTYQY